MKKIITIIAAVLLFSVPVVASDEFADLVYDCDCLENTTEKAKRFVELWSENATEFKECAFDVDGSFLLELHNQNPQVFGEFVMYLRESLSQELMDAYLDNHEVQRLPVIKDIVPYLFDMTRQYAALTEEQQEKLSYSISCFLSRKRVMQWKEAFLEAVPFLLDSNILDSYGMSKLESFWLQCSKESLEKVYADLKSRHNPKAMLMFWEGIEECPVVCQFMQDYWNVPAAYSYLSDIIKHAIENKTVPAEFICDFVMVYGEYQSAYVLLLSEDFSLKKRIDLFLKFFDKINCTDSHISKITDYYFRSYVQSYFIYCSERKGTHAYFPGPASEKRIRAHQSLVSLVKENPDFQLPPLLKNTKVMSVVDGVVKPERDDLQLTVLAKPWTYYLMSSWAVYHCDKEGYALWSVNRQTEYGNQYSHKRPKVGMLSHNLYIINQGACSCTELRLIDQMTGQLKKRIIFYKTTVDFKDNDLILSTKIPEYLLERGVCYNDPFQTSLEIGENEKVHFDYCPHSTKVHPSSQPSSCRPL